MECCHSVLAVQANTYNDLWGEFDGGGFALAGDSRVGVEYPYDFYFDGTGTRVLCMKTIFQIPACFCRKADSNHF